MHLTAAPWSRSPRCSGRTRWPAPATDDPLTRAAPVALRRTGHVLAGLDRHPLAGPYASVMADPVEHAAGPPPDRRPGPPEVHDAAPGAGGPLPYAHPQAVGRQAAHAPGWYRRSVIVAVLASLAVPALHGASWFTGPDATSPSAGVSTAPRSTGPATGGQRQSGDPGPPSATQVAELLASRARAVVDRDRAAWLAAV